MLTSTLRAISNSSPHNLHNSHNRPCNSYNSYIAGGIVQFLKIFIKNYSFKWQI